MKIYKIAQSKLHIWLDDERDPTDPNIKELFGTTGNETWIKTIEPIQDLILQNRVGFIDFDNDLGEGNKEGRDLALWLEEKAFNNEIEPIEWHVHSQNTIAAPEIAKAMQNADKFWAKNQIS